MTLAAAQPRTKYSHFDEQLIIAHWLARLDVRERFFVDVAAGDGRFSSNTLALAEDGWAGLSVECDAIKFAKLRRNYEPFPQLRLADEKITPDNIIPLLRDAGVPQNFGLLSLDIDSYDHFVLDRILQHYRPALMCIEINEKVPPPISFTVNYSPDHVWREDHFYGMSLSKLDELRRRHAYAFVELEYANVFMVPAEISPLPSRDVVELYRSGYLDRPDRREKFPWNEDMEPLHTMSPSQQVAFVRQKFANYTGRFSCGYSREAGSQA